MYDKLIELADSIGDGNLENIIENCSEALDEKDLVDGVVEEIQDLIKSYQKFIKEAKKLS